jgi:hypothetical protein
MYQKYFPTKGLILFKCLSYQTFQHCVLNETELLFHLKTAVLLVDMLITEVKKSQCVIFILSFTNIYNKLSFRAFLVSSNEN